MNEEQFVNQIKQSALARLYQVWEYMTHTKAEVPAEVWGVNPLEMADFDSDLRGVYWAAENEHYLHWFDVEESIQRLRAIAPLLDQRERHLLDTMVGKACLRHPFAPRFLNMTEAARALYPRDSQQNARMKVQRLIAAGKLSAIKVQRGKVTRTYIKQADVIALSEHTVA